MHRVSPSILGRHPSCADAGRYNVCVVRRAKSCRGCEFVEGAGAQSPQPRDSCCDKDGSNQVTKGWVVYARWIRYTKE